MNYSKSSASPLRHERVFAIARKFPDLPAIIDSRETVTYSQLQGRVDALAQKLKELGVANDTPVGVCHVRSAGLIVAMLAILRAGGGYVPIDPDLPESRIAFVVDDAAIAIVLCDDYGRTKMPSRIKVLQIDEESFVRSELTSTTEDEPTDRLAYVLHTSGSTGRPKGVAIREHAVVNLLDSLDAYIECAPGDHVLFTSSVMFDVSTVEIFLPLVHGGCVVVANREQARDGLEISNLIDRFNVKLAAATPSAWRAYIPHLEKSGMRRHLQIISAGEALAEDLAHRLVSIAGVVLNGYGPTEATIYASMDLIVPNEFGKLEVSIGRPLAGVEFEIVKPDGSPVAQGEVGELLIKGVGLARGYIGLPEATAERFRPSPSDGRLSYWTGDLGRWNELGKVAYSGRIDDQIKIRGQRIEPGEIESRLCAHPSVRSAIARPWTIDEDTRLIAYVIPINTVQPSELRAWCADFLPNALVPSRIVLLEEFPLNENGKVDVRALPDPRKGNSMLGERNAIEDALCKMWAQLLWVDQIAPNDDFFDLGGDSLAAMSLIDNIEKDIGVRIPLRVIFDHPVLSALVDTIVTTRKNAKL
jgi:amino acid adenylation domain-containing protein